MHHSTIENLKKISARDIELGTDENTGWHSQYKGSAYIYIGGLDYRMNEGDTIIIFSQFGEVVDCHLVREEGTGKSKGFAFLAYEDQRSTILAVDNLNGINVLGRVLKVDHVEKYRVPKEYLQPEDVDAAASQSDQNSDKDEKKKIYKASGPYGDGWGDERKLSKRDLERLNQETENIEGRPPKVDENAFIIDEDERWERQLAKKVQKPLPEEGGLGELEAEIAKLEELKNQKDRKRKLKEKKEKHRSKTHKEKNKHKQEKHRHKHERDLDKRRGSSNILGKRKYD